MSIVITYPYPLGKRISEEKLIRCGREEFLEKGYAKANERKIMEYICAHRQECELVLEKCSGTIRYPSVVVISFPSKDTNCISFPVTLVLLFSSALSFFSLINHFSRKSKMLAYFYKNIPIFMSINV
ncbi:MAG TPA: hypothetical protein DCG10_02000 [Lachnospiraceae bacterium]|nr:hypothetical protein [Lachnospiraceae bacterium]